MRVWHRIHRVCRFLLLPSTGRRIAHRVQGWVHRTRRPLFTVANLGILALIINHELGAPSNFGQLLRWALSIILWPITIILGFWHFIVANIDALEAIVLFGAITSAAVFPLIIPRRYTWRTLWVIGSGVFLLTSGIVPCPPLDRIVEGYLLASPVMFFVFGAVGITEYSPSVSAEED